MAHIPSPATGGYFPPSSQQTPRQQHQTYAEEDDDEDEEDNYTPAPKRGGGFQRKGSCWPKDNGDISPGTEAPPSDEEEEDIGESSQLHQQATPQQHQQQWHALPNPAEQHYQQYSSVPPPSQPQQSGYPQHYPSGPLPPHLQQQSQQPQHPQQQQQPIYPLGSAYGSNPPAPPPPSHQQQFHQSPYLQHAQQPHQPPPLQQQQQVSAAYSFAAQQPPSNRPSPQKRPPPAQQQPGIYQHEEEASSDQTLHDVDLQNGQGKSSKSRQHQTEAKQRKGGRQNSDSNSDDDDEDEDGARGGGGGKKKSKSKSKDNGKMARKPTTQLEDGDSDEDSYRIKGGILSQLMRGFGGGKGMKRSNTNASTMSRSSTAGGGPGGADIPTMSKLGFRARSDSLAGAWYNEALDPDDPRISGVVSKKLYAPADGGAGDKKKGGSARRASIQYHVADILERHNFVLKLARALMVFGAPSHRIESQLNATARVLEIDAQFIHFPNIVIASFGDQDTKTSETHFVKAASGLELGKLHKVHAAYRRVVHDEISVIDGTQLLNAELKGAHQYGLWQRMAIATCCSGLICPLAFGGSFIDAFAAGGSGCLLSFLQLYVAKQNPMYSNIFEITAAMVISFVARALAVTDIFCYQSVASAGVVLILPGYAILCGSLELASKNLIGGSVRMVYAIIYSLFLGFGIAIGSDLFFLVDPAARRANLAAARATNQMITVMGSFVPDNNNGTSPMFAGQFVFSNHTANEADQYQKGNVACFRDADAPWWRHDVSRWWLFLLVPCFSLSLSLWNAQPFRSKQLPVMIFISCASFVANMAANHFIFNRSDVVSCIGAFVVGLLGNLYSRVFKGTAFTAMVTGVLFLVPSGIAAAGGLAMTVPGGADGDSYSQGLIIGFRMVQVAIGITVGLFGSGLVVYSFGSKKGAALFAF